MKSLTINEMAAYQSEVFGYSVVEGICDVLTGGAIVYGAGLLFNWWNPKGWIDATLLIGTAGCWVYSKVKEDN